MFLVAIGCRPRSPKKPPTPVKSAQKDKYKEVEKRHLAPPPAYGNKVVKK